MFLWFFLPKNADLPYLLYADEDMMWQLDTGETQDQAASYTITFPNSWHLQDIQLPQIKIKKGYRFTILYSVKV